MTDRGEFRIDKATRAEAPLLADLNRQLDEDEPHFNPSPLTALNERMARWIETGAYEVLLFRRGERVAGAAAWRVEEHGVYVRPFFICRDQRGQGLGRAGIRLLCRGVFPTDSPILVEALVGNTLGIAFWQAVG